MKLDEWLPLYERICHDFGFSVEEDIKSARRLSQLLGDRGAENLTRIREGFPKAVLICGGGPGLAEELSSLSLDRYVAVADSATSVLIEAEVVPSMIVTDLDGVVEDQVATNREGATVFVHAHGDNQRAIEKFVPTFPGPLVGTCQCPPPKGLVNFGGFTDGDRAACICAELGAERLYLAGFDFQNPTEKPGRGLVIKKKKLGWAKQILSELADDGIKILDATTELEMF